MKSWEQLHSCNAELSLGIYVLSNRLCLWTCFVEKQIASADILKADLFPCFSSLDTEINCRDHKLHILCNEIQEFISSNQHVIFPIGIALYPKLENRKVLKLKTM